MKSTSQVGRVAVLIAVGACVLAESASGQVYSASPNLAVPSINSTVESDITVSGGPASITNLSVVVDATWSTQSLSAFQLYLAKDNTYIALVANNVSGQGLLYTRFTSVGPGRIHFEGAGSTNFDSPFFGNFFPNIGALSYAVPGVTNQVTSLSAFNATNSNATWRLLAQSNAFVPSGTINYWSLEFNNVADPNGPPTDPVFGPPSAAPYLDAPRFIPGAVRGGETAVLTVPIGTGVLPTSTSFTASADLSSVGGPGSATLYDDGLHGDVTPGDHVFSLAYTLPGPIAPGTYSVPVSFADNLSRGGSGTAELQVLATTAVHEVEPNNNKPSATSITLTPGTTIYGLSMFNATSPLAPTFMDSAHTTIDYFKFNSGPQPLGIYSYSLSVETLGAPSSQDTLRTRGLTQTNGVINAGTDAPLTLQGLNVVAYTPAYRWYGFGRMDETLYGTFEGSLGASNFFASRDYIMTFTRTQVTPINLGAIQPGLVTFQSPSGNQSRWIYDANYIPIAGYGNQLQTSLKRFMLPGTYYMAVSDKLYNNQAAAADATVRSLPVTEANILVGDGIAHADLGVQLIHPGGTASSSLFKSINPTDVGWYIFTVAPSATPIVGGSITPASGTAGSVSATLNLNVAPASSGSTTITSVTADLSSIGGNAVLPLTLQSTDSIGVATYTATFIVPTSAVGGAYNLPYHVTDGDSRTTNGTFSMLTINPWTTGTATLAAPGQSSTATITITPATPAPSGLTSVSLNLTSIGGSSGYAIPVTGSSTASGAFPIGAATPAGTYTLSYTATDASGRTGIGMLSLRVLGAGFVAEIEPNDNSKPNATHATIPVGGGVYGSMASSTDASDYFLLQTSPAALGLYRYRLTLVPTSSTSEIGFAARGLSQSGGVIGTDNALLVGLQFSTASNPKYLQWYGFGKQEQLYYDVRYSNANSGYVSTLTRDPVLPINATGSVARLDSGEITIAPGVNGQRPDWWVYDAGFSAIPGMGFAQFAAGPNIGPSAKTLTFSPGTYYLAIGPGNLANNLASPPANFLFSDEDWGDIYDANTNGNVCDFPNIVICNNSSTASISLPMTFTDASGHVFLATGSVSKYDVLFYRFSVGCAADFDGNNVRDVADLFAYINAWLAKTPNADFNHDNVVDVADLFGYINAWLAGC